MSPFSQTNQPFSNLQTQELSEEVLAALNLGTVGEVFLALLEILRRREVTFSPSVTMLYDCLRNRYDVK